MATASARYDCMPPSGQVDGNMTAAEHGVDAVARVMTRRRMAISHERENVAMAAAIVG